MEYNELGSSGIIVSRICFGSLTISPLQSNLSVEKGSNVINYAMERGINFLDTAEYYDNYPYIKHALKKAKGELIIASKSYAYSYEGMRKSVEKARSETGKDVIDIFMLHEQETALTLKGHREALDYLIDAKARGLIRAIGVSTHTVEVVRAAAEMPEIDVIHPIINFRGIGIKDGNREDMEKAIVKAFNSGKGLYGMKCLGGGNLLGEKYRAFNYIKSLLELHSVAVGMKSEDEVLANTMIFESKAVPREVEARLRKQRRRLLIEDWCEGCGRCITRCRYNALRLSRGKSVVDDKACILCGYCAAYCPEFCIKMI
jgi:predicted aldo/keto reductase-like oxidoreductase